MSDPRKDPDAWDDKRDYFAGCALTGLLANPYWPSIGQANDPAAESAYFEAEALMKKLGYGERPEEKEDE